VKPKPPPPARKPAQGPARDPKRAAEPPRKYDTPWKPWRPKHREHLGPPETAADLMGQVLARLGGQGRALEFRVFDCYTRLVGELLRTRTAPERLAGTTLFVRVATSALAHEVTLMRGEILDRLNAELGPGTVTELRTRVGKIAPRT
jgi:hypothetical protein